MFLFCFVFFTNRVDALLMWICSCHFFLEHFRGAWFTSAGWKICQRRRVTGKIKVNQAPPFLLCLLEDQVAGRPKVLCTCFYLCVCACSAPTVSVWDQRSEPLTCFPPFTIEKQASQPWNNLSEIDLFWLWEASVKTSHPTPKVERGSKLMDKSTSSSFTQCFGSEIEFHTQTMPRSFINLYSSWSA